MGGHGGLNILPQKRWNVYNFDNREKVKKDEEEHAQKMLEEKQQQMQRDGEVRQSMLLERARMKRLGVGGKVNQETKEPTEEVTRQSAVKVTEKTPKNPEFGGEKELKHINLFENLVESSEAPEVPKLSYEMRRSIKRNASDMLGDNESLRLGYGVVGKTVEDPWYSRKSKSTKLAKGIIMMTTNSKTSTETQTASRKDVVQSHRKRKSTEELRQERFEREYKEKERTRELIGIARKSESGSRGAQQLGVSMFKVPQEKNQRFNSGFGFGH